MNKFIFSFLIILSSCIDKQNNDNIEERNLYKYSSSNKFFDVSIFARANNSLFNPDFPSESYSSLLNQLSEESLTKEYKGHDIVRLTVMMSFDSHYTIRIDKQGSDITLTTKRTFRDSKSLGVDTNNNPIFEDVELDSIQQSYFLVKYVWLLKSLRELSRKKINPILELKTKKLKISEWDQLMNLFRVNSFFTITTIGGEIGFDGNHFLIEVHTKDGYYLVDRWSPPKSEFKDLINEIIKLSN